MPRRTDINKILIIGSGPIVIGQACEFDYSGTQACKALREDGFKVVLINSNPATIMTDPEFADATYIEPITPEYITKVIQKERPDALLPTLGGQTGLNAAVRVAESGVLAKYNVKMIGADLLAIKKAEDRDRFKAAMRRIGLECPESACVNDIAEARAKAQEIGFPVVIRPSYTLGGTGGGIAYNVDELNQIASLGLELSLNHTVLIEKSVVGWKEFEMEVMRDIKDNVVIICSIENFDPMGVHTGDSITVAPAQTLTDKEYQRMRDASIACIREIGVATGGSNIQFAIDPATGRMVVIEMNPRVSRSSALASKATGFPIAKIAAKLAVGYTLDEIPNDITRYTPACFEPAIDYCVVKLPRFTFEKFPGADQTLTTQMKSVGETMAIGRTFKEALQKGLRGLEIGRSGLDSLKTRPTKEQIREKLLTPNAERLFYIKEAFRQGWTQEDIARDTRIDPWFLRNIREIIDAEDELLKLAPDVRARGLQSLNTPTLRSAKELGFSDRQLAAFYGVTEADVRALRLARGVTPAYKLVDTCAAEFEAYTPYYYSTYESEDEAAVSSKRKVMILGGGPNRIGQGIEFDYCCVHASFALKELGFETIMVNSNPETVSTDYDTSDRLYFEPLTYEDVMNIIDKERPDGVIVQFGGQTPLNLTLPLANAGVKILGTPPDAIDIAEDRERFRQFLTGLNLMQPENETATSVKAALRAAKRIGYPVLVRPSYVLGGRAMEIVYDEAQLADYMARAIEVSPDRPILVDRFLTDAIEVDVDLVGDGRDYIIGGILEHIEEAGVHSGDAAMVLPPHTMGDGLIAEIRRATIAMAKALGIVGLMNVQFAVKENQVYVLEVNPRASRTVPFVSKAIGAPLAKIAAKAMAGVSLKEQGFTSERQIPYTCVKVSVFPFARFRGAEIVLGPEMRSTGEAMGMDDRYGPAYLKGQTAAWDRLPKEGAVFVSIGDRDKRGVATAARRFAGMGFKIVSTPGTARVLRNAGLDVEEVGKIHEGRRPNILDKMKNGEIQLLINTPSGKVQRQDERAIRSLAIQLGIPLISTLSSVEAAAGAVEALRRGDLQVCSLQDRYRQLNRA
ncbi:MAG TPA: carbamoyl-phosphate synthase large subunit [Candidatus Brocadiia bacterium]|nr:carbamoyl-phosphate synthase large subunit [Candidatus Brocadiia bacterium]